METIRQAASELGVPTRALYLGFVRELPGVQPVIGCETRAQLAELLDDWSSEAVEATRVMRLADGLPTHEAELVDPSRWPRFDLQGIPALNQTRATSIATIPA